MSRASEITLFLIIVQASIGFVDAIDLFDQSYLSVPANNDSYTLTDLEEYTAGQNPGVMDELLLMAQWAIEAFMIGIKVILKVIFFFFIFFFKFFFFCFLFIFFFFFIY